MMRRGTLHPPLRGETLYYLLAVLALVVLPHTPHLPPWLSILVFSLGAWRFIAARQQRRMPPAWLRILLTLVTLTVIFADYGTLLGRDSGTALLIAMLGLKLLEIRETRDIYVVVFLGYFLVIIHFLFSQSMFMAVYMLGMVAVLTAVLIDLNRRQSAAPLINLRLAGAMLARALPLMLVLFVLFPRISGPLWGLPNDAYSGMTGLSDEMSPGQISQLGQSDAIAFRANFEGAPPEAQQRYWRGPVFSQTDGESWRAAPRRGGALQTQVVNYQALGEPLRYAVMIEPHNKLWLFALDLPAEVPPFSDINDEFQLLSRQPVRERLRYEMRSYPDYKTGALSETERQRYLQLPIGGNPRARGLATEWRRRAASPAEIVQTALRLYRTENFIYTLSPPLIGDNFVDGFLFDTRKGFCEHYAGSFAFLMRAAGIPTRVVTGYQGGELNELGNYFIVRQRDAHAWAEVWLDGSGWQRVDPTAAVAPERVERGIDLSPQEEGMAVRFELQRNPLLNTLWRGMRHGWDAVNTRWNEWVLGFDAGRQSDLLSWLSLGGLTWQSVAIGLLTVIGVILCLLVLRLLNAERRGNDPVTRLYQRFCRKLARRGLARAAHEGPEDYARRVSRVRPELAHQVRTISALYIALRYGARGDHTCLPRLRREVRAFHP